MSIVEESSYAVGGLNFYRVVLETWIERVDAGWIEEGADGG